MNGKQMAKWIANSRAELPVLGLAAFAWIVTASLCSAQHYTFHDVLKPKQVKESEPPPIVSALAFHPDGNQIAAVGDDHSVKLWDIKNRRVLVILRGHEDWIHGVCYLKDGKLLATVGSDGRLFIWDLVNRRRHLVLDRPEALSSVTAPANGNELIVTGFGNTIYTVNYDSLQATKAIRCDCHDLRTAVVSPDGRQLASGSRDGVVNLWSAKSGERIRMMKAHQGRVMALSYSADGEFVLSGGADRKLRVWDRVSGYPIATLDTIDQKIMSICPLPDGLIATGGSDNDIRLWSLEQESELERLRGHTGTVATLVAQGNRMASGGFDATIRVWSKVQRNLQERGGNDQWMCDR